MSETLALAQELIGRRSVTPDDAGCQALIAQRLRRIGFLCETLPFEEVTNLWARRGGASPLLVFAGHTDVVPPGPESQWTTPPFEPTVVDGMLYGRGAADMKSSIAAFVTAVERFVGAHGQHEGSLAVLLTSDEEGAARHGTARVMDTLSARGEAIDYCLVGEPSSETVLADTIKIGRRGSLHGHLNVRGVQGHVAYPQRARNPIHDLAPALLELTREHWDDGNASFPPTTLQISNIAAGAGATNVIPDSLRLDFNLRYSNELTAETIQGRIEALLDRHELDYELHWRLSARPYLTGSGALLDATVTAIHEVTGRQPYPATTGGTSDGRFIAPTGAQVVELGPLNGTIHQIDERVLIADIDTLSEVYERILERILL